MQELAVRVDQRPEEVERDQPRRVCAQSGRAQREVGHDGERRSGGGILIPATAQVGRRLSWARVVATGPNVRTIEVGDQVLFDPESHPEVEIQAAEYVLLRERDIHALAAHRVSGDGAPGLYL